MRGARIVGTRLDTPRHIERPVALYLDQRGTLPDRWVALSKLGHVWVTGHLWNTLGIGGVAAINFDPLADRVTMDCRFEVKSSGFGIFSLIEDPTITDPGQPLDIWNMNRNFPDNAVMTPSMEYDPTLGAPGIILFQDYCGGWFPHIFEWRLSIEHTYLLHYEDLSGAVSYTSLNILFTEE